MLKILAEQVQKQLQKQPKNQPFLRKLPDIDRDKGTAIQDDHPTVRCHKLVQGYYVNWNKFR